MSWRRGLVGFNEQSYGDRDTGWLVHNGLVGRRDLSLKTVGVAWTVAVGVIMFNSIPAFLGSAAEALALDNAQLGALASSNFAGQTIMTIVLGVVVGRLNVRRVGLFAALISAISFLLMTFNHNPHWMMAMLFVAGLGGGTIFVIAMAILMSGDRATRNIGLCFFLQLSLAAIVVYVSPAFISPRWGLNGVIVLYAVLFAMAAPLTVFYDRRDIAASASVDAGDHPGRSAYEFKSLIPLISISVFFLGTSGVWAFLERIGAKAGFGPNFIGAVLMGSLIAGALSSLVTTVLENRIGIRIPIAVSCTGIVVALLLLVRRGTTDAVLFAVAVIGFQCAWVLAVNYIAAAVAWLDRSGRHSPLLPAFMWIGAMAGPFVTGILSSDGYVPVITMCVAITVTVVLILAVSPLLRGARPPAANE